LAELVLTPVRLLSAAGSKRDFIWYATDKSPAAFPATSTQKKLILIDSILRIFQRQF